MREIKFRALFEYLPTKERVFYYLLLTKNGIVNPVADFQYPDLWKQVKDWEQYTGLKDKNGVEIYEWDILKVHHFHDYTGCDHYMYKSVLWNNKLGCWYFASKGKMHNTLWVLLKNSDCEIIGNIHETPELLQDTTNGD